MYRIVVLIATITLMAATAVALGSSLRSGVASHERETVNLVRTHWLEDGESPAVVWNELRSWMDGDR